MITAHYGSGVGTDTVNSVRFLSGTTQNLIATANALADALTRHIRNQDANSQAATTPYHFEDANKIRIPVMRANDAEVLALAIEELWLCLESHRGRAVRLTGSPIRAQQVHADSTRAGY